MAIRVEGLGKRYRIGGTQAYKTLRDSLANLIAAPLRGGPNGDRLSESCENYIWALKDVSFDVRQGEVVGIVGPNGAGKTTLLKILSRITDPTEGCAQIHGRVGSLLDVGTGFHPELTGRENIYLNGAILGMKKDEIRKKFNEIVDFSEIGQFIDTPMKYYSDGMYVRLAFAVAAHLEPEVLVVDEVLAVGDVAFQKKCLGKMDEVAKGGRTVILVSHNMAAVLSLCERAIQLDTGRIVRDGYVREVVQEYLKSVSSTTTIPLDQRQDRSGDGSVKLVSLQLENADKGKVISSTSRLKITIGYRCDRSVRYPKFLIEIFDYTNTGIFQLDSEAVGGLPEVLPPEGTVTCITESINLTPGRCYVSLSAFKAEVLADAIQNAGYFDIFADDVYGSGKIPSREWVICILPHKWILNQ